MFDLTVKASFTVPQRQLISISPFTLTLGSRSIVNAEEWIHARVGHYELVFLTYTLHGLARWAVFPIKNWNSQGRNMWFWWMYGLFPLREWKKEKWHSLFWQTMRNRFAVHLGVTSRHFPSNNSSSWLIQLADNTCGLHSKYQQTRVTVCKTAVWYI